MNDPRTTPPFDDPRFDSELNDLDREPRRGDEDEGGPTALRRAPPGFPFEAERGESAPRTDAPRRHRPLLDLFPPTTGGRERPPGPLLGTALPPFLPRSQTSPDTIETGPLESYELFYGLSEKPFALSSDPKFFYRSASHGRALDAMLAAIQSHDGIVVLTGAPGLGKTTLCRTAARELDRRTVTSIVFDPFLSVDQLLTTLLIDFGVISRDDLARAPDVARDMLASALGSFLESLVSLQATAVVMIDEAQKVPPAVLAEVPAAFAAVRGAHLIQLVLVGQQALHAVLKRPELVPLAERVDLRLELGALAKNEIAGYVTHRLSVVDSSARLEFSEAAFARIFELSRGVPRVVNLLCDRALGRGSHAAASVVDTRLIDSAAGDLGLASPVGHRRVIVRALLIALVLIALTLAGAGASAVVFHDEAARVLLQWMKVPPAPRAPVRSLAAPLAPVPVPTDAWTPAVNGRD